ncbi:putative GCY1-galactose-induced protein of aldo/keto reductase family [Rhodotorula diobovata]|uniref:Putative GCY1-galactose-induced protein of aldo/keto reductase family n=1 Tax=Rhodotorula diobovata TaxID=5288 RepID=A0A5C5FQK7_9BASI|nr:putative GCY1-galactose-induced protein of aldo/keto reductase family [Rhodotorula diobovata]
MPPFTKTFELAATKIKIPAVGLGTWKSEPGQVRDAVRVAIESGYRHIDCAWAYKNEAEVGQGIRDSGIDRKELFVTSKLWNTFHSPDKVAAGLQETLDNLGLDHLDLYLLHWPVAFAKQPSKGKPEIDWALTKDVSPTWAAMEKLVEQGKTKHIGVSNFTIGRCEKLLKQAKIKPAVNQVELNLHCSQPELVQWSHDHGILLEAYSPLGSTGAPQLSDSVVKDIAAAHGASPAQVLISWQVKRGIVVLPKSVTPQRIKENFESIDLSADEVSRLNKRASEFGTQRTVDPSKAWGVPDLWKDEPGAKL